MKNDCTLSECVILLSCYRGAIESTNLYFHSPDNSSAAMYDHINYILNLGSGGECKK